MRNEEGRVSIPQQIERAMLAGLDGSLQFVLMNFRLAEDSAHRALRHAPSIDDAEAHFAQDGREFRPPTATAARAEADGTVREHGTVVRNAPIRSNERLAGVGDEAYLWVATATISAASSTFAAVASLER